MVVDRSCFRSKLRVLPVFHDQRGRAPVDFVLAVDSVEVPKVGHTHSVSTVR